MKDGASMKINYTNYLRDKPQETDPSKLAAMKAALIRALRKKGQIGRASCRERV